MPNTQSTQNGNGHFWHTFHHEVSAQAGEGGGARPPPFTISTITYEVVVYAPAERVDALPLFLLYPYMYSVGEYLLCLQSLNT
jgi:hypothetical protein